MSDTTFLYFAYGSNLLRERILINNPSAVFRTIARLDDYALCFDNYIPDGRWHGASATINSRHGDHVWGIMWEMSNSDLESIDRQEGVHLGIYRPLEITVQSPAGESYLCRSYQLILTTDEKLPSPHYLSVIRRGAAQNELPGAYQERLAGIEHNGYQGELSIMKEIEELVEKFKKEER